MMQKAKDIDIACQVESHIRSIDSLAILPHLAAILLPNLTDRYIDKRKLADIIKTDPTLTAKVFDLAFNNGINLADNDSPIEHAVEKLPWQILRDALISLKVLHTSDTDKNSTLPAKQFALHNLAVASCASEISSLVFADDKRQLAFSAGLLHDIGKMAINRLMPKSFERIVDQAKAANTQTMDIEQKNLNLDHSIIGKRLAEKWHFPKQISLAIWLHHSDTAAISQRLPNAKLAAVIQLADIVANQSRISSSGSFGSPDPLDLTPQLMHSLSISAQQLQQLRTKLPDKVTDKAELIGLNMPAPLEAYTEIISETAAKLAKKNTDLSTAAAGLQTDSANLSFINDFLQTVCPDTETIDIAAEFARQWKKFYQTGPVAIYLTDPLPSEQLQIVTVDDSGNTKVTFLDLDPETLILPEELRTQFAILDCIEHLPWLFEQLDCPFNPEKTKIASLNSAGKTIALVIFENRLPIDPVQEPSSFASSAAFAAHIIALAAASQKNARFTEEFPILLTKLRQMQKQFTDTKLISSIAEIAAGAAHELNNPLSVISGRVQLLTQAETNDNKKRMLAQIKARTDEISHIVTDLMAFAKPVQPAPEKVSIQTIIDSALAETAKTRNLKEIEAHIDDNIARLPDVYADPVQLETALANIISNALDSYPALNGPITFSASPLHPESVIFQISDSGCGMNPDTLSRAFQPFFSEKPAGRKRGMGLAHAKRLITLNNGSISLNSSPDRGTAVIIQLPKSE